MLLRLMAGLILPTEGEVWIDGKKLGKDLDFPPSMGLMIENPAFLPNFTGRKIWSFWRRSKTGREKKKSGKP
jgi:ABC-2 type transport system ATP-binding protein